MQETLETRVWSLNQEDPMEEGMAIKSSILAWEIPQTGEPGGLQSTGCRVGHDWATKHSTWTFVIWSKGFKVLLSKVGMRSKWSIFKIKLGVWKLPPAPGMNHIIYDSDKAEMTDGLVMTLGGHSFNYWSLWEVLQPGNSEVISDACSFMSSLWERKKKICISHPQHFC